MALFVEFKPLLSEIARYLRIIATKDCCTKSPTSGTQALDNPLTLSSGFTTLRVVKTSAAGTVTITFPDTSTYVLSAENEVFEISKPYKLGEFTITIADSATYKFYTA